MKGLFGLFRKKQSIVSPVNLELFKGLSFAFALHEIILDKQGRPVDYRFIDVNPAFEEKTGLKRNDIIGKRVLEVLPQTEQIWIERYGEVALTGKPQCFEQVSAALNKYFEVSVFSPKKYMFVVVFEDITHRIIEKKFMSDQARLYVNLFESSNDMLMLHDFEGIVVDVNKNALEFFGKAKHDLVGKRLSEVRFDQNEEAFINNIQKVVVDQNIRLESVWRDGNNRPVDVEVLASVYDAEKKLILANIRNISEQKKSLRLIRESESRFMAIFMQTTVGIVLLDMNGIILEANQKFCSITGFDNQSLKNAKYNDFIPGIVFPLSSAIPSPSEATGNAIAYLELRILHKNGNPVWLNQHLSVIENDESGQTLYLAVVTDISEVKQARKSHQISEEKLQNILKDQSEFFISWKTDGTIIFVNEAYCKYYNVKREEKLKTKFYDQIDENVAERIKLKISTLSVDHPSLTDKHCETMADGSEVWHEWTDRGFFDEHGELFEIHSIGYDITRQVQAEQKLNVQNLYFEYLFNNLPQAIVILNADSKIVRINNYFTDLFLFTNSECEGKDINNLIVPESHKTEGEKSSSQIMGGQFVAFQSVRIRKDKSVVNISFIGLPLINNGEVIAAYGIYRDISIEKKAEEVLLQAKEKAEESDRLKSAFLATMSHELRTPLNAIIGFSSLIDESYNVIEILDYLKIINQSGNHLLGIINDMFHLSVLEAGEININRSYFKPALLFLEVMDIIGSELNTHNKPHLKLVYNSVPDLDQIEIFSDYQKIEQVLMIFLKNSIKFTDEGFIEYGFYLTDKDIVFYVKDSGVGIAPEKLNVIFEKFRQADETSTRTFGGIGIGLTIARELVNILKGSIFVESTLSAGSNFGFSISRTEAQVKGVKTTKVTGSDLFEGKRVLVAEDEESNFLLLDSSLKTTGVTIFRAYNGKEAVDFVHRNPAIDLILMDLKMPVLDGFIATTEIKKAFPQIPIIAQTAYAMVGDRAKAIQAGCDDYISKPIRRDALIALMKKYIR